MPFCPHLIIFMLPPAWIYENVSTLRENASTWSVLTVECGLCDYFTALLCASGRLSPKEMRGKGHGGVMVVQEVGFPARLFRPQNGHFSARVLEGLQILQQVMGATERANFDHSGLSAHLRELLCALG